MTRARDPALVILAAGASTRLAQCKALAPLADGTPLDLLCARGACFDGAPTLVVTGADHDAIAARCPPGVEILWNADWRLGRTGGVRLASVHRPGLDLCLAPVDVPRVPAEVFAALLQAWRALGAPPLGWLAPAHSLPGEAAPRFGHPVVVGKELLGRLAEMDPGTPLHALRAQAQPLSSVPVARPEVLDDLDDPEDFQRMRIL
ncbi:MAG TPA: NTP transferase domain-containing protein [Planctomycetota bacterium]|nr:NTP transferase domain-containing protein [Planctomycetota bacterium]